MPKITDWNNLHLAFYKAQKGKARQDTVKRFSSNLDANLRRLQQELITGKIRVGDYHYFKIYDPKERLICAAAFHERVMQHALMNVCHPFFERYQIFDSYASRVGKGTYAAIQRAQYFCHQYTFFAKLDVRKYFETIDHQVAKQLLTKLFKDKRLLAIFDAIINSYQVEEGKGLPIGNLFSQYLANHLLAVADHYVKEQLKQPAYLRYMDDMVLWSNEASQLRKQVKRFSEFLEQDLCCELKPVVSNRSKRGLPFLGYVCSSEHIRMAKKSKKRFRRKLAYQYQLLNRGCTTQAQFQQHVQPLFAFTSHAQSKSFRNSVLWELEND